MHPEARTDEQFPRQSFMYKILSVKSLAQIKIQSQMTFQSKGPQDQFSHIVIFYGNG